jgi:hypothetical protein
MKPVRLFLFVIATLAAVLALGALLAFNAGFQTWAVRRVLARRPALGVTLGSISAGLGRVEIKNLRIDSHGAVLTVPSLEVELPLVAAGLKHQVTIARLVAKGWTLDLTKAPKLAAALVFSTDALRGPALPARRAGAGEFSLLPSARAADAVAPLFQGIFAQLVLPIDLVCDGADLAGEVILPAARGHARLTFAGGGLGAGREARFELTATAALTSTAVSTVETRAIFTATMDTPRTFTRLGVKADATASGPQFPRGVKISADASALHAADGENYALALATADKQLISVTASFPSGARKLACAWKVDARDADVAPFLLGHVLPPLAANGEGQFDFDGASAEIHASGKVAASCENLGLARFPGVGSMSALAALGALRVVADFDLTQNADATRVDRFSAVLSSAQPIAKVDALQTLTFHRATRALAAADPARDLFSVVLQGVPLAWMQPLAPGLAITGGDVRGQFTATASDGGFSLRPKAPLTAAGISVVQAGRPLVRAVDLGLNPSVDYTPHGWQVSAAPLLLKSGTATVLTIEAKAGQLAGADQPIKVAGKLSASLPALLAQPAAGGVLQLARGDLAGEFLATLGATQAVQAKLAFTNLEADPKLTAEKLPAITAEVRADIATGGQVTFNAPLLFERAGRKSDLTLTGTLAPGASGLTVAANVASTRLVIDDLQILAAPFAPPPATAAGAPAAATTRESSPPWAGVTGQVSLALKEVVYSGTFQATDVTGTLRIDAGAVKFEGLRAGLGNGSDAKISGAVTFSAKEAAPYVLNADLAIADFDPGPLFKALNPGEPATVEGKFNVTSKLTGSAAHLGDFATETHGDFQLSSKGGLYRGLPVTVSSLAEKGGRLANLLATGSSVVGALTGKKEYADIANKAQAVAEIAKLFSPIQYDQLNIVLTRDASLNTVIKDFTLIAPEMRIAGQGRTTHRENAAMLDEAVALEFKLRARGHTGDLFKYLGALETQADELGYLACTLPLKIGGTLGKPDTSELNKALATLALEKGGASDKASDLLNKFFGK